MAISVSDYVFQRIAEVGVKDVFLVSGGWIMHLSDSVNRNPNLNYIINYHEQACAIAAEAYARVNEKLGVCLVTAGPGSTNALTGVAGAYVDSIPMLVVSGQVRTQIMADPSYQRQVGPQEIYIDPMAKPVTKYFVTLMDSADTRYEIEKCIHTAMSGRPGPTWINIPLDIQPMMIEPETQRSFVPKADDKPKLKTSDVEKVAALLEKAQRPILIAGNGVVLGGARSEFRALSESLSIPVLSTISAMDLMTEADPLFQGRFGPGGQRRANFALQNADLVVAVGTSLSISCIGYNDQFAPKAEKVLVNIDPGDLEKRNVKIEHTVLADAKEFLVALGNKLEGKSYRPVQAWLDACAGWKRDYPPTLPKEFRQTAVVDAYDFYDELSKQLGETDIVMSGNSLDGCIIAYQAHQVKAGQRAFTSVCFGPMGWDLPALVGACAADRSRRGVLITGDGSFLFNVQELMVIGHLKMNAKMFISNNEGYASIRGTQDRFCEGRHIGVDAGSGVVNPDFKLLAQAFGINYIRIESNGELSDKIATALADDQPWIIDMNVSQAQVRMRAASYRKEDGTMASRPIEDMDPLLPREEIAKIMATFA